MNLSGYLFLFNVLLAVDSVLVFSSFWAPLFNPKVLNYRVDARFDPQSGLNNRDRYKAEFGYRGENLIADLGNGKPPNREYQNIEDVNFYYTY